MAVKTAKKAKQPKQKQVVNDNQRRSLQKWNLWLGLILVAQAIAIVVLAGGQSAPITTQYLATDALATDATGSQAWALATRHLFDIPLSWVVASFLTVMAAGYLLVSTLWRQKYEAWLELGINKMRWIMFGLGGGVMVVAIAMLSGISDISFLVFMGAFTLVGALLSLAVELLGPGRRLIRLLIGAAVVAGLMPWLIFKTLLLGVLMYDGSLPTYVYYVYASMFLIFVGLVIASFLRLKRRGKWADTFYAERMFMLLGFVEASLLAWQIFAGALLS